MQANFARRRATLLQTIEADSIVIISSAPELIRNGSVHYPYRQRSHFYYLTGFHESQAILLLANIDNHPKFVLFCLETNNNLVNWATPSVGLKKACLEYGADEAYTIHEFPAHLSQYLARCQSIYCLMQEDECIMQHLYQALQKDKLSFAARPRWIDISPCLDSMRVIKEPEEIAYLRQAASISVQAHRRAMRFCRPGIYEYEIAAELHHEFERRGCQAPAYPSIVASGNNACILHYQRNRSRLRDGELLLIDAGCEYKYYAADITRTFPINGKFSYPQKQIYALVLQAQTAAIHAMRPGVTWAQLEALVKRIFIEGLMDLGLISPTLSEEEKNITLQAFYPHRIGHHLGLDVHDGSNQFQYPTPLQANNIITVEPGLYIQPNMPNVTPEWHGIGVRIEDDILITEAGYEVLSENIPKAIEDIEEIINT
jgi:Xaa-Pro aminopeptidase